MSREYITGAGVTSVAATQVALVFLNPGTSQSIEILRAWVSQSANATSAQQPVKLGTQAGAGFPVVVGVTPRKTKLSDPVSVLTSGTGTAGSSGVNSSAIGTGAQSTIIDDAFNVLNGWLWVPTPPETHVVNASATQGYGLYFPSNPTTQAGWSFGLCFREL
jgi:hypothetical protein